MSDLISKIEAAFESGDLSADTVSQVKQSLVTSSDRPLDYWKQGVSIAELSDERLLEKFPAGGFYYVQCLIDDTWVASRYQISGSLYKRLAESDANSGGGIGNYIDPSDLPFALANDLETEQETRTELGESDFLLSQDENCQDYDSAIKASQKRLAEAGITNVIFGLAY